MAQGFLFAPAIRAEPFKELAHALNGGTRQLELQASNAAA
jgi:hypothetical protein